MSTDVGAAVAELQRAAELLAEALEREHGERMLYRLPRAAEVLDTPLPSLRRWIAAGELRMTKIGRNAYIARGDLVEFVNAHRQLED